MINTEALKIKIIDLAVQGQLTEQLPEDGSAEELYQQIQEKKQMLIEAGEIKKEKKPSEIQAEEIPFSIPSNWMWVRLKPICTKIVDGDHNPPSGVKEQTDYLMLSAQNINNGKITNLDKVRYLSKEVFAEENKRTRVQVGDVLLTIVGTIGRSCVYQGNYNMCFQRSVCVITTLILPEFLKYALDNSHIQSFMKNNATGAAQLGFYLNKLEKLIIPLPPLDEQHRIVERIEHVLSVLNNIDVLQEQYVKNLIVLKRKLINTALQGQLTEQLPEDGTAEELYQQIQTEKQSLIENGELKKDKQLPEIKPDEVPFEIPTSWKWVRLASICHSIFAGGDKPQDYVLIQDEKHQIPVVANGVSNEGIMGYTSTATAPKNTLTIAGRGTIGFPCYRKYEFCPIVRLIVIVQSNSIDPEYLYYVFLGMPVDGVGSSIPQLTVPMVKPKLVPLPPLPEQKRIVKKLNDYMSMEKTTYLGM